MSGVLVLVGTPIGNLSDLSPRAAAELGRADVVCCEDTRRTGKLFELAGIERRPFLVVNDHTEPRRQPEILERLAAGERVALVTDAGMPGVSDPGERLVAAAVRAGHTIEVVPGPSAAIAALVGSGLPTSRFVFEGFLPRKGRARSDRLEELSREPRTIVIFESPHRVRETIGDLAAALGEHRRVAVARELTKMYEEYWRGSLGDAAHWADETPPRGEIALVVEGAPARVGATDGELREALGVSLAAGESKRDAVAAVAAEFDVPKRRVYDLAVELG